MDGHAKSAKRLTRAEQKVRTRNRLVEAAARVIARRGLGATSVDEISEHAGFSSGAFYSNFSSKDEVFAKALEYHVAEFADFFERERTVGSPEERLAVHAKWMSAVNDWRILFWLEIIAEGGRSRRLRPAVAEYLAAARRLFAEELEKGAKEAERPLTAPAEDLATIIWAAELGLFIQSPFDRDIDGEKLLRDLTERLLQRPGIEAAGAAGRGRDAAAG